MHEWSRLKRLLTTDICGLVTAGQPSYTAPCDAGWSSQVARRAHNPEVAGSNPAPATGKALETGPFYFGRPDAGRKLLPNFAHGQSPRIWPELLQSAARRSGDRTLAQLAICSLERWLDAGSVRADDHAA